MLPLELFDSALAQRAPFASSSTASAAISLFDHAVFDRVLARGGDVLVVARGALTSSAVPRSLADARTLLERGESIVVRRAERCDDDLRRAAEAAEHALHGRAHVQLFVTPAQGQSFGWHYDAEDVFIVQTVGTKAYYFRANTVVPPDALGAARPDFTKVKQETAPLMSCTLAPGDWLHLPRGTWHVAKAIDESLSISLGLAR